MADHERFRAVEELFQRALGVDAAARESFLAGCGADESVVLEVKAMLAHDEQRSAFLDGSAVRSVGGDGPVPESVGPYRVLGVLGRGGMGVVYRAEQDNPRRVVALKIVSPGLWGPGASRRLEKEAQALGRLHHPGIAQIYEAGTFPGDGGPRPFFAMELVEGVPLDVYADREKLGFRERLGLVARLCDAVQHAHDAGIVHRDLKPGNVLVGEDGEPRILDFGVARLTESDVHTVSLRTDAGALVGTVPYMSPEQAAGDPSCIDARSDVYALGVIAYELLTSKLPYAVRGKLVHEAVRVIREDDPDPMSTSSRVFRGDVETIIGKALEKPVTRRYQTAAAFGEDIRRYLSDRAIRARPPSTAYQLAKFYRRNRALVTAVAVVMLALAGATVVSSAAALRASRARAEAVRQARIAEATNAFMNDHLFSSANPWESGDPGRPIREVLDVASAEVGESFPGEPVVEASVRMTLGDVYNSLGLYEQADPHLVRAIELFEQELGPDNEQTLLAEQNYGELLSDSGRYQEALEARQRAMVGFRMLYGDHNAYTVSAMSDLSVTLMDVGRFEEAERLLREADAQAPGLFEGGDQSPVSIKFNLGACLYKMDRVDEAGDVYAEGVELADEVLGPTHPETLGGVASLALVRQTQDRNDEAAELYERCVAAHIEAAGAEHPYTLTVRSNYALFLTRLERYDEAEAMHKEILAIRLRTLGEHHPDTAVSWALLAQICGRTGRPDEAVGLYEKAYAVFAEANGPDHPFATMTAERAAKVCDELGRAEEAERWRALAEPPEETPEEPQNAQ